MITDEQIIGLAAATQALIAIDSIAFGEKIDDEKADTVLNALLVYNTERPIDAYKELSNLSTGLTGLKNVLANQNSKIARYLISAILIEYRFIKSNNFLKIVQNDLESIREDFKEGEQSLIKSEDLLERLTETYKKTFSQIEPRILIQGKSEFLRIDSVANRIRSLLFACLRGVSFFRQSGGSRVSLIFNKQQILERVKKLEMRT